ncbi:MAG TPA: hypothetical protein VEV44_07130 [Pseudoneobacillus sp.]|nr:hypothetical protein [Pseudoneobacillus sp.]
MEHQSLTNLAEQHKKLLERYDVFPYEYQHKGQRYKMIHFYRLTNKLYGSYLYTPLAISYDEVKEIFYHFLVMQEYMKGPLDKYQDFASRDFSDSFLNYQELLERVKIEYPSFQPIVKEMNSIINHITYFQDHLKRVREISNSFQNKLSQIKGTNTFTFEDLMLLRQYLGEASYYMYSQGKEQEKVNSSCKIMKEFMSKESLNQEPLLKELYDKTLLMLDPKLELKLQNSMRSFGDPKELEGISKERFIEKTIYQFEKYIHEILDEDFILRRVRNQSVQGRGK